MLPLEAETQGLSRVRLWSPGEYVFLGALLSPSSGSSPSVQLPGVNHGDRMDPRKNASPGYMLSGLRLVPCSLMSWVNGALTCRGQN